MAQMVKCLTAMWETWDRSLGQEEPLEKDMATHSSTLAWKIPWKGAGHSSWGMCLQCSPLLRLRIKFTFLFSLNSISIFFIQLWWAEKAKILASNNIMMAIQLQLYISGSVVGAGRLNVRRVAQIGHQRTCRWADHNNKNMIKTSEHLPKRNCCKINQHNSTLFVLVLLRICLKCRRPRFDSWVRKICWRRDRLPIPIFLGIGSQRVGHSWVTFTFTPVNNTQKRLSRTFLIPETCAISPWD